MPIWVNEESSLSSIRGWRNNMLVEFSRFLGTQVRRSARLAGVSDTYSI